MPLYSYIPYLDPDIADKEKRSFSGNNIDTDDEQESSLHIEGVTSKLSQRITADTFTKKVNENLRNLNNKMTDLLQDGLGGVDNICRKVRDLINDNQEIYTEKYVAAWSRGDVKDDHEERSCHSQATTPLQETVSASNNSKDEKLQEIYHNTTTNSVFAMQQRKTVAKDDNNSPSRERSTSRPTSKNLKSRKSDPKSNNTKLTSKSFDATVRTFLNAKSSEKIKPPKTRTKRKTVELETKPVGESCAKKRLGQIERDYQKVVENLGMVERMMACVNERIMKQKKERKPLEIVNSKEKTIEHSKIKKKTSKYTDKNLNEPKQKTIGENISLKELTFTETKENRAFKEKKTEKMPKEVSKRRRKEVKEIDQSEKTSHQDSEENRIAGEIMKQMKSIDKINNSIISNGKQLEETIEKTEALKALNPLSKITINGSLSDIDAMIDNAVMELGNLVSTEFYMSRNSSDVSFNLATEDAHQTLYDECNLVTSSSTSSDSANALSGQQSDKFHISQSFEELKKTFVQKIKEETTERRKKTKDVDDVEKNVKVQKNSYEEIFNDSSWNKLDQIAYEYQTTDEPAKRSSDFKAQQKDEYSDMIYPKAYQDKASTTPNFNEQENELGGASFAMMREYLQTQMEAISQDQIEEIMKISLPSTISSSNRSNDTKQLDDDTFQMRATSKYAEEFDKELHQKNEQEIEVQISRGEFAELERYYSIIQEEERTQRTPQSPKTKEKKARPSKSSREKVKSPKSRHKEEDYLEMGEEAENGIMVDAYTKNSTDEISTYIRKKQKQAKASTPKKSNNNKKFDTNDIKEIKKVETNFSECSSYSSFLSFDEDMFPSKENQDKEEIKPIDPMKPISLVCKKLISDLVVEQETISLEKIMNGYFNSTLIRSLVCRFRRPHVVRVHTPINDPDLKSIVPEVHRKKAIPDLHERMELQIRQTDSFDGFLSLMNKSRRKALIRQAERQDHSVRCQMRACFRKKYPFRVVTASVPAGFDSKFKDKKEPEKRYINSLWFSPKDFKLRRNSRIFNRKRMEMYCQSLHKNSLIPKCKCRDSASRESRKVEKASNYTILVQSGYPLGRRPNTPRRWIQVRPPSQAGDGTHRPRLHHCDILDDLTLKDLAPFKAEYPRNDDKHLPDSLQGSLLYKLACGEQNGDANGTLMELISPRLSCTQENCKVCKNKPKSERKPVRKIKNPKKSGDESSVTSTKTDLQNLTPRAATQLLIQNIGEIKSRKSSTKSQVIEKTSSKHRETKTTRSAKGPRKNSRKVKDSKSTIHQRLEENMLKRVFQNQHAAITEFAPRSTPLQKMAFKDIDHFQKILKVPELYPRPSGRKSNVTKLFPYINDPDNRVFQNITVLPVKVFYNFESLRVPMEKGRQEVAEAEGKRPVNIASLSETDEFEVSTVVESRRPSTAEDKANRKKITGKRRIGTPKSPTVISRQNPNKFANLPPAPPTPITYPLDLSFSRKSKETIGNLQEPKTTQRRSKFSRSSSLGKSPENDNTAFQMQFKRPSNPHPWKPASRRPRTPKTPPLPKQPTRIRSKERSNFQQFPPIKTISTGWIPPKGSVRYPHKTFEKCLADHSRAIPEVRDQHQMQTLVNKDKKMRSDMNPAKNIHDVEISDTKSHSTRASLQKYRPLSPRQRVMVDHLHMLRNRNGKLQGNIQKAINIIEEKMVDVLSTNDQSYKKKTIDRMEREINKVLKMINEQNCFVNKREENKSEATHQDAKKSISKTDNVKSITSRHILEEDSQTNTKALVTQTVAVKMPKPPRKRSISRVIKHQSRPSTVEEENTFDTSEENKLFRINEGAASEEEETICKTKEGTDEEEQLGMKNKRGELYPSSRINEGGEIPLCPVLRCPTPNPSNTKLSNQTKTMLRKMSREAFGKFADVVRTKTRLIIDMTERIDMDDTSLLPNPKVTSALPAILARTTNLPVITTIHQPRASDLMSTTVSSIVSVHQTPIEKFVNAKGGANIAEFVKVCEERSITSFSDSGCYTWRKIGHVSFRPQSMGLECSSCTLKRKISHDLTPFMRALNNLKAGRLFEKRHQLLPIEETSPNFGKMMNFLEGLSRAKESINQTRSRDVQLMWNPEKRCSFHNSIEGTKKIRFSRNTKAFSEHSMIQYPATSISELLSEMKIQETPSEAIGDTKKECVHNPETIEEPQLTIIEKTDEAEEEAKETYESKLEEKLEEKHECKLVFSEVQLISICSKKNLIKKYKRRSYISSNYKKPISLLEEDRYSSILKMFYFIFYTFVYFCMTAMNFSC